MSGINSETKLLGVIGNPVSHSLSPIIFNKAFQECGLNLCYSAFNIQPNDLEAGLQGMVALGFLGFNVTLPFKEAVLPFLDSIHRDAKIIGAVNTVVIKEGRLCGYNTDGSGFVDSLEERGIKATGKNILLIGAGGAAKAVAVSLALQGVQSIVIANRTLSRAQELSDKVASIGVNSWAAPTEDINREDFLKTFDIVVNATPIGMKSLDEPLLLPVQNLSPGTVVCDLIYRTHDTRLLREASTRGFTAVDGSGMLLHQGARAFQLFTGHKPPLQAMRKALAVALCQSM